jgi:hypothetical protein
MRERRLVARGLLAALWAAIALSASSARADDSVRACIAASTDGQTLRNRGALLGARDRFLACARDACPEVVRSQCARWLADLEQRTPTIVVRAQDATGRDRADASIAIDGAVAKLDGHPVPLDPGEHVLTVTIDAQKKSEKLLVVEGERTRVVVVRLDAAPAAPVNEAPPAEPPSRSVPLGAWIVGGVGIAAIGGGVAFALAARSDLDALNASCSPHCTDAQTHTGRTHALLADILFGVGGVAIAGAVVWAFVLPSSSPSSALRVDVRPVAGGAAAFVTARY